MRRIFVAVSVLAVVTSNVWVPPAAAAPGPAAVDGITILRAYDVAVGSLELPEGVAVDKRGSVYVTFPFLGELRRLDRDGSEQVVANLPMGGGFGPLGVTPDASGNLYVGVVTTSTATQGVYRVTPHGTATRLPGTEAIAFANDVSFGDRGTLYVADSVGKVWRIPKNGAAELFSDSPLLAGDGSLGAGFPIGANGITYRHRMLYVTVTEQASIVAIPVRPDGSAGEPSVLVQDPTLYGADGVELDVHGNFFVPVIAQSTLVHVAADTLATTVLLDGSDGLDFPSSVAFGTGSGERSTLYGANFSVGPFFGGHRTSGPQVLAMRTNATGLPQP